jgi:hypothetical protein
MEKELLGHGFVVRHEPTTRCYELYDSWKERDEWPSGLVFHRLMYDDLVQLKSFIENVQHPRRDLSIPIVADLDTADYRMLPPGVAMLSRGNVDTTFARAISGYVRARKVGAVRFFINYRPERVFDVFIPIKTRTELHAFDPSFATQFMIIPHDPKTTREQFLEQFDATVPDYRKDAIVGKYEHTTVRDIHAEMVLVQREHLHYGEVPPGLWVFTNNEQASDALAWLRANRRKVPGDVDIVSLDNDPASFHRGISACILDWDNAGYLMAHALLNDIVFEKTTKGFMRLGAQIVHRETTKVV